MKNLVFGIAGIVALALGAWGISACSEAEAPKSKDLSFPKGFLIGTAIAGFQGDMGCPTEKPETCEDRHSDWYQWVHDKDVIGDKGTFSSGDPVSWGPGHWELYAKDYVLMKEKLSANSHRMSIEWSRIFPKSTIGTTGHENLKKLANPAALKRYRQMFEAMIKNGIKPLVTINHYTLPLWIHNGVECRKDMKACKQRGWMDPKVLLPELEKLAAFVAKEYGDVVDYWITINEPFAVVLPGYLIQRQDRVNPPALSLQFEAAKTVLIGMIEGHARIYKAIKANDKIDADKDGKATYIGLAYNAAPVYPKNDKEPLDIKAAKNTSYLLNEVFFEAIINGKLDEKLDGKFKERKDLIGCDFIGINYYGPFIVTGLEKSAIPQLSTLFTADPLTLSNEPVDPEGLYKVFQIYKKYNRPFLITENGFGMKDLKDDGTKQASHMVRHLFWIHKAIQEGLKIEGYMYWSFVDNYEWNHGFDFRFGLYQIDVKDKTKARKPRKSVSVFHSIASQNKLSEAILKEYLSPEEQKLLPK